MDLANNQIFLALERLYGKTLKMKKILLATLLGISLVGCNTERENRDNDKTYEATGVYHSQFMCFEGIIMLDRNPPFQSGGDLRLSPTNLSDKYRKDQQKLKIKYKFTNSEVSCVSSPFGEIKTRRIKIITVKKI